MNASLPPLAGLGLRRTLLAAARRARGRVRFSNARRTTGSVGGRYGEAFAELAARHPIACYGLSLSLGGVEPLDETFLARTRRFSTSIASHCTAST